MTPTAHVIASALTSAAFAAATQSWEGVVACFLSGIFIDIDHHFDVWIYRKKILFHIKHIYDFCEKEKGGRLYLMFHSYELLAAFWMCIIFFHLSTIWLGVAVGLSVHLLLDQWGNTKCVNPWTYFLWYRLKNNFSKEAIFSPEFYRTLHQQRYP